ncbi:DNA/RNA non-specific endonuclease [Mucilaginibacter terrae]|uniref:Endonuclease G n=1 Tax=Mucilaginibacter terrae TaxID=1955052 RepID=A0ABU3GYN7_9SPHI|nr:DNA/RNA non-specific endonuclease [Mucilaginibacter terrae]MDT3404874.1 endonuclease G [Mucilaginibacter terrae]
MQNLVKACFIAALTLLVACNSPNNNQQQSPQYPGEQKVKTVEIAEDFESVTKPSYAAAQVKLKSGLWYFEDALIAGSNKDAKEGSQSVRIKGKGLLRMEFDLDGASKVTIKQAAYAGNKTSGWQLKMSVDGGKTYTQVGAGMVANKEELQTVTFIVNHKGPVRFEISKTSGGNNRINIDDFTVYSFNPSAPPGTSTQTDTTAITDSAVAGDNTNLLLGNPSNATTSTDNADNYLMEKPYYTLSYNHSRGTPNWVSWYVGKEWLGRTRRSNDFRSDESLPKDWYRVQSFSYQGSGFERGHNCPSADRASSTKANSETFLMTNMIPQAPANNQHTWGNLEGYERMLVNQGNEVYVVMGSYGIGGYGTSGFHKTIDKGRLTVPAYIWKVIVVLPNGNNDLARVNAATRLIAVITPNNNGIDPNWTKYICTVRDIEKATGYDLLSKLPKQIQDVIEARKDKGVSADDGYIMRI